MIKSDNETKKRAAKYGYFGMFSHRDTLQEALDYATDLMNTLSPGDNTAGMIGLMVFVNTVALAKASEKPLEDKFRNMLQKAYCMEKCEYEELFDDGGWGSMQRDVQRWYCNLDSSQSKKFVDWCEDS